MGLELIPNRHFKGEEIEIIRKENEEISGEEKEILLKTRRLKEFWASMQPFLTDIGVYEPVANIQKIEVAEGAAEKEIVSSEQKIANKKEKEREIDLPYIAEKITIGYLHSLFKNNKIQEGLKELLNLNKDNYILEICFPSERADWILGDDGYILIKKRNSEEEIIKAIPIQITAAVDEKVRREKFKKIEEKSGILLVLNIKSFDRLIDKYLQYLKEINPEFKEDKQQFKDRSKAPWDLFEVYDVKEKDDILIEGRNIKEQLINSLKFLRI